MQQQRSDLITGRAKKVVIMKKRSLAGNCGIGVFVIAFVTVVLAFGTSSWLESDTRITSSKFQRLGLWEHCFRSLPDVNDDYQKRFFVGCRWIFDPFTKGYDEIRGFLVPPFMIATQFFFTLCFIGVLICLVTVLLFFLCCGPDMKHFVLLIRITGFILLAAGINGSIAVIVFASFGNRDRWMPGYANNWFGWSFILACIGAIAALIAAGCFLTETNVQLRKRRQLKESQSRFEMEQETKA